MPDSEQGRVYRALTLRGECAEPDIAAHAGLPAAVVRRVLAELEELGAVRRAADTPPRWSSAPPEHVMSLALAHDDRRRARLWQAAADLDRLYHQARGSAGPSHYAELVEDPATLLMLTGRLQEQAGDLVRWLDRPPYHSRPQHFRDQERRQADRMAAGVRYRVVYSQDVYDDPALFAAMVRMAELGEDSRVLSELPVKLTIGDEKLALLVPDPDRARHDGALVVHSPSLLRALVGIFETLWTLGMPVSSARGSGLSEQDRTILTLMAAGATDDAIARRLELSRRTVVRRIAALLDRLGATTRFQAGAQAAKRGLL